ncbi:nuclear transport factor 2 family protein [Frankia sp. Ag45/Mut15]|uniref:Nuclear transport factor 2 family protein n=1 Tax=Frankia umida TaxID=573489 RepID=A0ABT0JSS4_9ACTN|nr:nuclear transport factor 2 family protein [Frankia umida]MCK9874616.1 nuclear transport factor 2 family protein [Frankia umida]
MTMAQSADLAGLGRAEDQFQSVVAANDSAGLADVLHDDLVARGHDGLLHGRAEDVAGYASGAFAVTSYVELRRHCLLHGATGVTFVRAAITARISGEPVSVVMDYTRTWVHDSGRWQIIAAHLCPAPEQPRAAAADQ